MCGKKKEMHSNRESSNSPSLIGEGAYGWVFRIKAERSTYALKMFKRKPDEMFMCSAS